MPEPDPVHGVARRAGQDEDEGPARKRTVARRSFARRREIPHQACDKNPGKHGEVPDSAAEETEGGPGVFVIRQAQPGAEDRAASAGSEKTGGKRLRNLIQQEKA